MTSTVSRLGYRHSVPGMRLTGSVGVMYEVDHSCSGNGTGDGIALWGANILRGLDSAMSRVRVWLVSCRTSTKETAEGQRLVQ